MDKILPLYKAELRDDVDGITAVSLVKYPAVEKDFITFSKEKEQKKKINFVADEEKQYNGLRITRKFSYIQTRRGIRVLRGVQQGHNIGDDQKDVCRQDLR